MIAIQTWISWELALEMFTMAAQEAPRETGGVLMGYWTSDGSDVVVTHVVGPGAAALHTTTLFVPDHDAHLRQIERIYLQSGRVSTYLGDWHAHPAGGSLLSATDRRTLRRIASTPSARADCPLMGIVARDEEGDWHLAVWILGQRRHLLFGPRKATKTVVELFEG